MRLKGKKPIFNVKDTWNLDATLKPIIAEGLKKFLVVISAPDCCAGCPSNVLPEGYKDEEQIELGLKEWYNILNKMIYAFEVEEPELEDGVLDMVKSTEDTYGIEVHKPSVYAKFKLDREQHFKDVQEGLDLFAKHYNNLWW